MSTVSRSEEGAPLYPLFIDLRDRRVLVVGAGQVAARRVGALLRSRARLTVVARVVNDEIAELGRAGAVELHQRAFRDDDVAGHALVFSATGDAAVDSAVSAAARAAGVFVNVADELGLSEFHVPAVHRRGDVQVAVSTGGTAPGLAARVRDTIADVVRPEWGRFANLLGGVRRLAKARIPDPQERMAVMRRLAYDDGLMADVTADGVSRAETVLEYALGRRERESSASGLVSIVGAGPGDPDLITVAGRSRLRQADVVVYDDLVDERLLGEAPEWAELIYCGKRGWLPNDVRPGPDLLVAKALERPGMRVVRLKGGDPSVFGRLAEELDELEAAGVAYEVLPGVTAALAAAARAKVPLTRRGSSASITLATVVREGSVTQGAPWSGTILREGGTLAIYMGLRSLREFAAGLVAEGVDDDLPILIVAGASTPKECVVEATLASAATAAESAGLESPALILAGRVFGSRRQSREYQPAARSPHVRPHGSDPPLRPPSSSTPRGLSPPPGSCVPRPAPLR